MGDETLMFGIGRELGEAAASIQNALADKKIDVGESIDMGKELVTLILFTMKTREHLVKAFENGLDDMESADIKAGFAVGYALTNPASEETIERMANAAIMIIAGISIFVDVKLDHDAANKAAVVAETPVDAAPTIPTA